MQESVSKLKKLSLTFGLLALFLFQLISTILCFKTQAELFKPEPIINIDWCSQYYWSYAGRMFFSDWRKIWGFDPYYMAGYPLDFIFNSSLPVQLSNIIFSKIPIGLVIKWFFLLTFLSVPFVFYFSLLNFGLSKISALFGSALGVSYFWLGEDALFGNWGMISGSFMLNLFLLPVSSFYSYLIKQEKKSFILFTIFLTLSILVHKTALVLVGLPCSILFFRFIKKINLKTLAWIISALSVAILANLFWLFPFFQFLPNKIEDPTTTFFQNTIPLRFIADLIPLKATLNTGVVAGRLIILIPAIYGIFSLKRNNDTKELLWFIVLFYGILFFFVYFGSFCQILRHLQPYRYLTALFFILTPCAGFGLEKFKERISTNFPIFAKGFPAVFIAILLLLQTLPSYRLFSAISPLTSQFPKKVKELQSWIENNTDLSARIMIEDINAWEKGIEPYGASRFVGILPAMVPRYLVGGPLPNAFIKHNYVNFHDGYFLNRKINEYNEKELEEKFNLYNIKWVICWTECSKQYFEKSPITKELAEFNKIKVFETNLKPSWFLLGEGELKADYNKIELKNIRAKNNMVVLKMHWLYGFKTYPKCKLFKYDAGDDPIGFIAIENPPEKVLLRYEP